MALSKSERQELAEIEKHLHADDPRLARILTRRPERSSWRHVTALVIGLVVATVALPAGVDLNGGPAGPALFALGGLALLTALTTAAWMLWTSTRPTPGRWTGQQDAPRRPSGTERWRNPSSWWFRRA